jgi:fluoride exporter
MNQILWIAIGGALGAVLRYLMVMGVANLFPFDFPLPTLLVNIIGSFAIGALFAACSGASNLMETIKPFVIIGLLGGFTTFSSYSMESIILFQKSEIVKAFSYIILSNIVGISAAWFGFKLFEA